ncbi:MAG: hypothetical protein EHM28_04145 [Spirochaetaceae bacterium]|nr:MAG: hypothetical protein EHM28_04145 [Spirochaetaceae bacterium]
MIKTGNNPFTAQWYMFSFLLIIYFMSFSCIGTGMAYLPAREDISNKIIISSTKVVFDKEYLDSIRQTKPNTYSIFMQTRTFAITYLSDGLKVKGYIAMPLSTPSALPCVIYNRGGNLEFSALSDQSAAYTLGKIASWGYVVAASQYRGVQGGEGREEFGGADVNDILNMIPLLETLPEADASRIGMYGWSRGGMMTYLVLSKSDRIAAAVVGGGMSDMFDTKNRRTEMAGVFMDLIPGYEKADARDTALEARSAIRWPERLCKKTPILLLHGSADWRVHPSQALKMAEALYEHEHPFRMVFFEGGDHGLTEYQSAVDSLVKSWMDYYVRDRKTWPPLAPHGS